MERSTTQFNRRRFAARDGSAERLNRRAFDYYPRLGRVRDHFESHIAEPLSVTVAARIAGLNPSYFSSYFHQKVGVRFTDWLHIERVNRAKQALRAADHSIAEVARMVGFRDLRTFERAFKRHVATTPHEYKRLVRPMGRSS